MLAVGFLKLNLSCWGNFHLYLVCWGFPPLHLRKECRTKSHDFLDSIEITHFMAYFIGMSYTNWVICDKAVLHLRNQYHLIMMYAPFNVLNLLVLFCSVDLYCVHKKGQPEACFCHALIVWLCYGMVPALHNELGSLAFFLRSLQVICELFLEYLVELSCVAIWS